MEDSTTGSIFNADAEEDREDKIEEDRKNDGNSLLQSELDDTQSSYQLTLKVSISEKRRRSKLQKKGKNRKTDKGGVN